MRRGSAGPGMPPRALLLSLCLALAAAGCLGSSDPPAGGATPDAGSPVDHTGFFTSDMGLAPTAEADAAAVRSGSFFQAWAQGTDYPTWESDALGADQIVHNLSITLFVRSTGPVVESVRFPDIMVYAGAGGAWMGFNSTKFASVLVPGQVYEITMALAVPEGGLVIPRGERLGFKVVPVMHQNDAADVEILVGGEQATVVTFTATPTTLPAPALSAGSDAGEATGSAYAGDAAPPTVSHVTSVPTTAVPQAFLVWMNVTDHAGIPDIDLALLAPDGTQLAFGGTPTPREFIRLSAPNLRDAGEYSIVVTSYGSARATFSIEWLVG